jgi:hypothetical protein
MKNLRAIAVGMIVCLSLLATHATADPATALERYVAAPDPSYSFQLVGTRPGILCKTYVLEMTSQTWLTAKEVDKPV